MPHFLWRLHRWILIQVSYYQLKCLQSHGQNVRLRVGVHISSPENVRMGSRVDIAEHCVLMGRGGVVIGNDVVIGTHSLLLTVNHIIDDQREFYNRTVTAPISIGDHVWIGAGAIVLPGVRIGNHVIVGAGAVVTKDVTDNTTVVGIPARPLLS